MGLPSSMRASGESAADASCLRAFDQELDFIYGSLRRFGARPNDMDDLLQEVFLVLYRSWATLDTTRSLRPWLVGVAFRVVRTQRRPHARETPFAGLDPPDAALDQEDLLGDHELVGLLTRALERVPVTRRSVVSMHDLEGLEIMEIARRLKMSKYGVYARLHKGRKELGTAVRRLLKERARR